MFVFAFVIYACLNVMPNKSNVNLITNPSNDI